VPSQIGAEGCGSWIKDQGEELTQAGAAVYCEREKNGQQGREQDSPADTAGPGAQHWNKASLDWVLMDC